MSNIYLPTDFLSNHLSEMIRTGEVEIEVNQETGEVCINTSLQYIRDFAIYTNPDED